jgi:hypothetical protein
MSFAIKIFNAFKDEPQKAEVLFEFVEFVEKFHSNLHNVATKDDIELAKKQLELQIKQLESNTLLKLKELEGKIETTKIELEGKIETTKKELEGKIESTKKELEGKIETTKKELELKIEQTRSSLLRWSFLFWLSQMGTLIGILFSILKILQKI